MHEGPADSSYTWQPKEYEVVPLESCEGRSSQAADNNHYEKDQTSPSCRFGKRSVVPTLRVLLLVHQSLRPVGHAAYKYESATWKIVGASTCKQFAVDATDSDRK